MAFLFVNELGVEPLGSLGGGSAGESAASCQFQFTNELGVEPFGYVGTCDLVAIATRNAIHRNRATKIAFVFPSATHSTIHEVLSAQLALTVGIDVESFSSEHVLISPELSLLTLAKPTSALHKLNSNQLVLTTGINTEVLSARHVHTATQSDAHHAVNISPAIHELKSTVVVAQISTGVIATRNATHKLLSTLFKAPYASEITDSIHKHIASELVLTVGTNTETQNALHTNKSSELLLSPSVILKSAVHKVESTQAIAVDHVYINNAQHVVNSTEVTPSITYTADIQHSLHQCKVSEISTGAGLKPTDAVHKLVSKQITIRSFNAISVNAKHEVLSSRVSLLPELQPSNAIHKLVSSKRIFWQLFDSWHDVKSTEIKVVLDAEINNSQHLLVSQNLSVSQNAQIASTKHQLLSNKSLVVLESGIQNAQHEVLTDQISVAQNGVSYSVLHLQHTGSVSAGTNTTINSAVHAVIVDELPFQITVHIRSAIHAVLSTASENAPVNPVCGTYLQTLQEFRVLPTVVENRELSVNLDNRMLNSMNENRYLNTTACS